MYTLLFSLLKATETPCVTILLPLMKGSAHGRENAHRLQRLIDESQIKLEGFGLTDKGQSQFLAPAREFADQDLNLAMADDTLCLFLSPSVFEVQVIPGALTEAVIVGRRFHITPLLPSFYGALHYGVLALSRKKARFFEVRGQEVSERDIPEMPKSLADAWAGMERTDQLQGGAKDEREPETIVFCQKVAAAVEKYLVHQYMPVVFAGVKELWGLYRQHDRSGFLSTTPILGSPDRVSDVELAEKALPIVRQAADLRTDALVAGYAQLAGTGRTSTELSEILDAAMAGKVETLLLAEGGEQWGTLTGVEKTLHEQREEGSEELFGLAAIHTMQHRGHIAVVPQGKMPEEHQIAAVLRL